MRYSRVAFFMPIFIALFALSCQPTTSSEKRQEENASADSGPTLQVYTYQQSIEDKDLKRHFFNLNGANIEFNVLDSKSTVDQLIAGTINPDVLILDGVEYAVKAKEAGMLQPFSTGDMEENVPFKYKDKEGFWVAIGKSGIAVVFNKDKIKVGDIRTYSDLTKAKYKGKIVLSQAAAKTSRHLLAGMIAAEGEQAASRFAKALVANQTSSIQHSDEDVIRAIANGEGDLGLVDITSLLRFRYSGNPDDFKAAENLALVYPVNKDDITYLTFRLAAIPKNTSNRAVALRFVEYLTNPSAQQAMSAGSFLFPVNPMVIPTDFLIDEGGYKDLENDLNDMGALNEKALSVAAAAGWQ